MALESETSVVNSNPANVTVTVRDAVGPGGEAATVDIFLTVDATDATFTDDEDTTPGYRRNAAKTLIVWKDQEVPARGELSVTACLTPNPEEEEGACIPVGCIVEGMYAGDPYLATLTAVVCFP
jgi:hypothetical protein